MMRFLSFWSGYTQAQNYMWFGTQSDWLVGEGNLSLSADAYVGYKSGFSKGYHDYVPHYFEFDEEQIQFIEK